MTWITHSFFAGATSYILGLPVAPAMLGSTAPDWSEDMFGVKEHRGITHYLAYWLIAFLFSIAVYFAFKNDFLLYIVSFIYGGITHLVLDALTISGVPLGVGRVRVRIGGLIRTGKISEWVFFFVLVIAFAPFLLSQVHLGFNKASGLYERGIIDRKEYNEMRFKFF